MSERKKYFFDKDDSCHNYIIDASKREEWYEWLEIPEDDERSWDIPDFASPIDGITEIEFYLD